MNMIGFLALVIGAAVIAVKTDAALWSLLATVAVAWGALRIGRDAERD